MSLNYPVEISVISEDEGGGYFACIPLLPSCWSDGETFEEAYKNILEVKGLWIEDMLDRGMPINEPNIKPRFSGRFVVRVPKTLHRLLAEESEREGISLNQFV
uniref:toxin-antitoxin system HicB family antitoxin n=1 Tax=Phascolarctobacterium succinatutens TaxID=626940 RepID=UPI003AF082DC